MVVVHWKRHARNNAGKQGLAGKKWCMPKASLLVSMMRIGLDDPSSPLAMLDDGHDAILRHILSYTDEMVIPCTCCETRPVVYCCRRRHRLAILPQGVVFFKGSTTTSHLLQDFGPTPEDDGVNGEWPERFYWNIPNGTNICCARSYVQFPVGGTGGFLYARARQGGAILPLRQICWPADGRCFEAIMVLDKDGFRIMVLDKDGFRASTWEGRDALNLSWCDSHEYVPSISSGGTFGLTKLGFYRNDDIHDPRFFRLEGRSKDDIVQGMIRFFYTNRITYDFHIPHPNSWNDAENMLQFYNTMQKRTRERTWLYKIAEENPAHLQELYQRNHNNITDHTHSPIPAIATTINVPFSKKTMDKNNSSSTSSGITNHHHNTPVYDAACGWEPVSYTHLTLPTNREV